MWTFMRPVLVGIIALILALTSLTMAVARGQTYVAGEVVICSGYGMVTLTVDENGQPAGPVHLCPDMVLGLIAAIATDPPALTRPEGAVVVLMAQSVPSLLSRAAPVARARDPPALL